MRRRYPKEEYDYEHVWAPGWNSASLLPDYPRPSTVAGVAADSKLVLQQRHKGQRKRNGSLYNARAATYAAAKQYLKETGL
jgi:hypothetical protein